MNAAVDTARHPGRPNLRAYLAGTGATGSLIAGTVIVFVAIMAFVAFRGLPLGGSGGSEGTVTLGEGTTTGAPESAAAALGGAPGAVAATPAGGAAGGAGALGGVGGHRTAPGGGPGADPPDGGDSPPSTCTTNCGPQGADSGPLQNAVGVVDRTGRDLGLDPGLGQATQGVTKPLDDTTRKTLNRVKPGLGDSTDRTLNRVTDTAGDAVDCLLSC